MSQIADATDRLSYVVEMTEKAANRTMDLVEQSAPLVNQLGDDSRELHQEWQRFMRREIDADGFRELAKRIEQFLVRSGENAGQLSSQLNDILLAQDYQDLTGQVIKRVTKLVTEVEQPREAGLDGRPGGPLRRDRARPREHAPPGRAGAFGQGRGAAGRRGKTRGCGVRAG